MRVFVAGASGVIGRILVRKLTALDHRVTAMTRSREKAALLRRLGADAVVADGLDRVATLGAVGLAAPDVVIHQMTGLAGVKDLKNFDAEYALTNRLRSEGTDNLLEAAKATGVSRFVAQSYAGWTYERSGNSPKTEEDPFDPIPPPNQKESLKALRHLEEAVINAEGVKGTVLRYGTFYGPGTGISAGGEVVEMIRQRKLPIIGDGSGVWSFVHVEDAATATLAAMANGFRGIYNIVDDDPAPVHEWLPDLARAVNAKPPLRVPVWIGNLAAGEVGVSMMTQIRGVSNAKARRELGWAPRYKSWREGFKSGLE
ncbi:MAG TPA: NAD(P)-dependent oxidoreductase [Bacteroidota bacterium]|nr:NAD(P)-dependent oxidoreductase [Bacteroidota bacterium]